MLKRIELENFMSYDKQTISLNGESAVAIVGETGQGKSTLTEGVYFALYGKGRYKTIGELIRLGTTSMKTAVEISGNFAGGGEHLRVERAFGKKGGSLQVFVDGELKGKGGADPKNNQAQDYINTLLGVDGETFGLTAFFGMGGGDSLLKVLPSERLNTLQRLAGAELCTVINDRAGKLAKEYKNKIEVEKRALEVLTESKVDTEALKHKIKESQTKLDAMTPEIEQGRERAAELRSMLETYAGLRGELSILQGGESGLKRDLDAIYERLKKSKKAVKDIEESIEFNSKVVDQVVPTDLDAMQTELDEINSTLGEYKTVITLKSQGSDLGSDICPICDTKIGKDKLALLKSEADALKIKGRKLAERRDTLTESLRDGRRLKNQIENAVELLTERKKSLVIAVGRVKGDEASEKNLKDKIREQQTRISTITEQLKPAKALNGELALLESTLQSMIEGRTALERDIMHAEARLDEVKDETKKAKAIEVGIATLIEKQKAYSLVAEGFSRYEIPFKMLKSLRADIEKRASQIFREFTEGNILIKDVAGQRPGVDFVLADSMGERAYEGLSEGEKVMMYFSIRVAITQRENKIRDSKIDFLILDEVAGHLSPEKRDALIVIINKILRKYFPQVFMISHIPLREIFVRTLTISRIGGTSRVTG